MKWPTESLGNICDVISGGTPKRTVDEYWNGEIPWVKISDMLQGEIKYTDESITDKGLRESPARLLEPGTLLLSIFATVGRTAVLAIPAATNQAIVGLRIKTENLDQRYLRHYLDGQAQALKSQSRGVAQDNINTSILKSLKIPLPPLEEQRRIAAILDKADQLLGQSRLLIKEVSSVEQSIFESLFGEFVNGSSVYPVKALEEIVKGNRIGLVRASNECGSDLPYAYLKMDAIGKNGRLLVHKAIKTSASPEELADYSVRDGDVLFNTRNSRELVGKTAVYRGADEILFNNNIMRIRFSPNTIFPDFFRLFLSSRQGSSELESRKSGTTSVCAIYWKNLKTMPVPMPPYELQIRLAKSLESLESLSKKYFQQEMRCNDLARVLREQLVSGRN